MGIKKLVKKVIYKIAEKFYPNLRLLRDNQLELGYLRNSNYNNQIGINTKLYSPFRISLSEIGEYSYVASNSFISMTRIGKFCSIGPNLVCGWGIHPTNGLSTAPMFYSTRKQNGMTLSDIDKIEERKPIIIGNDVFIGANVTILDGVTIGDGAVIGAGAVVSKDIPAYAIAMGCPIVIKSYRFSESQIAALQRIKWWEFNEEELQRVEENFFDIEKFIDNY